jgi:hypothetical protein
VTCPAHLSLLDLITRVFLFSRGARSHTGSRMRRFEVSEWQKRTHTHTHTNAHPVGLCERVISSS